MARLRWACGTGVIFSLRSVIGPQAFEIIRIWDPKSMSEGSKWRSWGALWDPRVMLRKWEKKWGLEGSLLRAFWGDFRCFLGSEKWWKIMFFENLDLLIKNMIFWESCSRRGERLTFEGRGRFWRSAEPTKSEKSELGTLLKSLFWES